MDNVIRDNREIDLHRNYSLLLFSFIAAISVIFIHDKFPGYVGDGIEQLGRFAVPFFFMLSGFYLYSLFNEDKSYIRKRITRKIIRLSILLGISFLLFFIGNILYNINDLGSFFKNTFSVDNFMLLILSNKAFFGVHHWFLMALIYAYFIIYLFPHLFMKNDIFLYIISSIFLLGMIIHIIAYSSDLTLFGLSVHHYSFFTNYLLMGLPFVSIGILLKKNKDKISKLSISIILIILFTSLVLMVSEGLLYELLLKMHLEYGVFHIVFAISLYLLSINKPDLCSSSRLLNIKGNWVMYIYLLHYPFMLLTNLIYYSGNLNQYEVLLWFKPLLTLCLTIPFSLLINYLVTLRR